MADLTQELDHVCLYRAVGCRIYEPGDRDRRTGRLVLVPVYLVEVVSCCNWGSYARYLDYVVEIIAENKTWDEIEEMDDVIKQWPMKARQEALDRWRLSRYREKAYYRAKTKAYREIMKNGAQ